MEYPTYLIHFNKNHSPKNGQFTSGDGDGDNIRDDHHNYSKNKVTSPDGRTIKVNRGTRKAMDMLAKTNYIKDKKKELSLDEVDKIISQMDLSKYKNDERWRLTKANLLEEAVKVDPSYRKAFLDSNRDREIIIDNRKKGMSQAATRGLLTGAVTSFLLDSAGFYKK